MKKWVMGIILTFLAVTLIACNKQRKREERIPEFIFSYAENQSPDYPTTLGAKKFAELVTERTEGRIKILVQPEGVLGSEKEVIEQLKYGGIDFARISLAELSEIVPMYSVLQMPYLYRNSEHMWQVLDGDIGQYFLELSEEHQLVGLSWYDAGARNFYNAVRPIKKLEDIKGLNIRVQESELMVDIVEALGARAVPMSYDSVYSSLERGIIDGAENNWLSYESMEHYEVAKYYTVDEHTRIPEIQICASATWNKLSLEDQTVLRECAKESALYERALWQERERDYEKRAEEQGAIINVLSEEEKAIFQDKTQAVYEKYCGAYEDLIQSIIEMGK